jgi:hypothetical protein
VVAAAELAREPPQAGTVVFGSYWLSGRLLDEPRPERTAEEEAREEPRGLLRRLFG